TAGKEVARLLEEHEAEAQGVRWEIEAKGRAALTAAENEAKALRRLAESYRDNRAILRYELARRKLTVGAKLAEHAPQPVVVKTAGASGDSSALSTLLLAQILPRISGADGQGNGATTPSVETG